MEMKHFSHQHPLKPLEKTTDHCDFNTFGCCPWTYSSSIDYSKVYGCEECNYFIHRACSDIPDEMHHFYHPDHLLKLCVQQADGKVNCCACYTTYGTNKLAYRCVECPDFTMGIQCALMPSRPQNSSKSIHSRHHGHPLTLHERTDDGADYYCFVCGIICLDSLYRCFLCDVSCHESCTQVDLPLEIQHYFHPHPLRLTNQRKQLSKSQCLACQGYLWSFSVFECLDCASYMHIDCALLPDKLKQDGSVDQIHDFSHGHPLLLLCDSEENDCSACQEPCADTTYGCERCNFFIHDSCTGLPRQINHPLHQRHLLTLTFLETSTILCSGCNRSEDNFLAYKCSAECKFLLHVNCSGRNPTITFEGHKHVLSLITDGSNYKLHSPCIECGHAIIPHSSSFFSCRRCVNYKLHLLCGPLPCTITDKCHVDPLKLMDAFVEDYNETDEVYCDTCEQLRDPKEPVYYCRECNFITEIKCVMPEVLRCLEGHHGNVKLRTANETKLWYNGRVFSFQCANIAEEDNVESEIDINYVREKYSEVKLDVSYKGLNFFTIEEAVQILQIFQEAGVLCSLSETISERSISKIMGNSDFSWSKLISSVKRQGLRLSSEAQSKSVVPSYSNEALTSLMEKLDSFYGDVDFLSSLDIEAEIVGIGELMIMQELASYLKGLLDTHGDFTVNSSLGARLKMFFLNLLCSGVRSMCIANVREVDEITLQRWWKLLKIMKHAGFEMQFAIERLSKIALALFGRQVIATFAETKSQIDKTYDEVKELKAKLDAKERELEALKLNIVSQKKAMEYERTQEMKECLEYESELKWKKVWEGTPIMFQKFSK